MNVGVIVPGSGYGPQAPLLDLATKALSDRGIQVESVNWTVPGGLLDIGPKPFVRAHVGAALHRSASAAPAAQPVIIAKSLGDRPKPGRPPFLSAEPTTAAGYPASPRQRARGLSLSPTATTAYGHPDRYGPRRKPSAMSVPRSKSSCLSSHDRLRSPAADGIEARVESPMGRRSPTVEVQDGTHRGGEVGVGAGAARVRPKDGSTVVVRIVPGQAKGDEPGLRTD